MLWSKDPLAGSFSATEPSSTRLRTLNRTLQSCRSSMANKEGNQIFVTLRKGKQYPPSTCDVRVKYEQTIGDIKKEVSKKLGVPLDKIQLFQHGKELTAAADGRTLLDCNLHTGFSLMGYDLTEEPDYWPAVRQTDHGLEVVRAA